MKHTWRLAASVGIGAGVGFASAMAQVIETLQLAVDPATLVWLPGERDATVKITLRNTGSAIDIYAGSLYVTVAGPGAPRIWDVKLAGDPGTPQYLPGTFLAGTPANPWQQWPLQNTDPAANPAVMGAQPVSFYDSDAIQVLFDRSLGSGDATQRIPGNGAEAPFAEITLRRGDLGSAGPWTLSLFNALGPSPSFVVTRDGLGAAVPQNMGFTTETIVLVPEPESFAVATGIALIASRLLRRPRAASPR